MVGKVDRDDLSAGTALGTVCLCLKSEIQALSAEPRSKHHELRGNCAAEPPKEAPGGHLDQGEGFQPPIEKSKELFK